MEAHDFADAVLITGLKLFHVEIDLGPPAHKIWRIAEQPVDLFDSSFHTPARDEMIFVAGHFELAGSASRLCFAVPCFQVRALGFR